MKSKLCIASGIILLVVTFFALKQAPPPSPNDYLGVIFLITLLGGAGLLAYGLSILRLKN